MLRTVTHYVKPIHKEFVASDADLKFKKNCFACQGSRDGDRDRAKGHGHRHGSRNKSRRNTAIGTAFYGCNHKISIVPLFFFSNHPYQQVGRQKLNRFKFSCYKIQLTNHLLLRCTSYRI